MRYRYEQHDGFGWQAYTETRNTAVVVEEAAVESTTDDPVRVLEWLFRRHNVDDRPYGRTHRSMSVGDVVHLEVNGQWQVWQCCPVGWRQVTKDNEHIPPYGG